MGINKLGLRRFCVLALVVIAVVTWTTSSFIKSEAPSSGTAAGPMPDQTLDYFLKKGTLKDHNAADIQWYHAANSKDKITEALQDGTQMIEADVLLRGHEPKEPVMAHPPDNDSDITLREWLRMVVNSEKGIKLDFKRYSLTIWTGQNDVLNVEDLLPYRQNFSKSRIYYDLLENQISEFQSLPGYTISQS